MHLQNTKKTKIQNMKYIYTNKKRLPKNSTIEHNMFKCMC